MCCARWRLLASKLGVKAGEGKCECLEGRHGVLTVHREVVLRGLSKLHNNVVHYIRQRSKSKQKKNACEYFDE